MSTQQPILGGTATGSGVGQATGFELTSPEQPDPANIDEALARNRAFAAAGGHHGAGSDRQPRRRAPPSRSRNLPARHFLRARLRRRHRLGGDSHRGRHLTRSTS
jgi:hypothetical protein